MRIYKGRAQGESPLPRTSYTAVVRSAGRRGCTTLFSVSTAGHAIATFIRSYSLSVHSSSSTCYSVVRTHVYDRRSGISSSNKDDSSRRGAIRRQRLHHDDSGGAPAGGPGWHPSSRGRPFFGPSSNGHADAPRDLLELQGSSSAYLEALSSRSVTLVRAVPTTSCVCGAASDQAFGATCCSTTAVYFCGMLEAACFLVYSFLHVVL